MLVLARKEEESIVLDGGIEIRVLKIEGNKVQIGIHAPSSVTIRRSELPGLSPDDLVPSGRGSNPVLDCALA